MKQLLFFAILAIFILFGFLSCSGSDEPYPDELVDGIVIHGTMWATRNVATPGTFAATTADLGMLFQWNRQQGWAAFGDITGWNATNPEGTEWEAAQNPCPQGWRLPTRAEWQSLLNFGGCIPATRNDIDGCLFGIAPNQIFLPAAGRRAFNNGTLDHVNISGFYWTGTQFNNEFAWAFSFVGGHMSTYRRANGFSIRCVAIAQ